MAGVIDDILSKIQNGDPLATVEGTISNSTIIKVAVALVVVASITVLLITLSKVYVNSEQKPKTTPTAGLGKRNSRSAYRNRMGNN